MTKRMFAVIAVCAIAAFAPSLASCSTAVPAASMPDAAAPCDPAQTPTTGDLPDTVNAVLKDKCQACHSGPPQNHAPFAIVSFEDTQKQFGITSRLKWQRMAEVIEPGGLPHMPYGNAPQLTPDQLTTLQNWFASCAPPIAEGTGHDLLDDGGLQH